MVAADAGYGDDTNYRDGITDLGLLYVVGIKPGTDRLGTGNRPTAAQALVGPRPNPKPCGGTRLSHPSR